MRVSKWGNSLAVCLPAPVAEALALREGDDIDIANAGARRFEVARGRCTRAGACPAQSAPAASSQRIPV